jgi:hypothetical protein
MPSTPPFDAFGINVNAAARWLECVFAWKRGRRLRHHRRKMARPNAWGKRVRNVSHNARGERAVNAQSLRCTKAAHKKTRRSQRCGALTVPERA